MTEQPSNVEDSVWVRRHWNDWRHGRVLLTSMRHFHLRDAFGGVGARPPRPMLFARIWCDSIIEGEIAHSCAHGPAPHEVLVCIVQRDNSKVLYKRLLAMVEMMRPEPGEIAAAAEIANFSIRATSELLQAGLTYEQALAEVQRLTREKWPHLFEQH